MKVYKNFVTAKKHYRACCFDNDYMHAYINFTELPYFSSFESDEVGSVFIGYKMIEGVPLDRELLYKLKNKHEVAVQIADFLKELHGLPARSFNDGIVEKRDGHKYWSNMLVKIKENIFPHIREDSKEYISKTFHKFLDDKENFRYEPVIIHRDLGSFNIIFDTFIQRKEKSAGLLTLVRHPLMTLPSTLPH